MEERQQEGLALILSKHLPLWQSRERWQHSPTGLETPRVEEKAFT